MFLVSPRVIGGRLLCILPPTNTYHVRLLQPRQFREITKKSQGSYPIPAVPRGPPWVPVLRSLTVFVTVLFCRVAAALILIIIIITIQPPCGILLYFVGYHLSKTRLFSLMNCVILSFFCQLWNSYCVSIPNISL